MTSMRRRHDPRRPGAPQPFRDPETGFTGWTATIPGGRELTTPALDGDRLFLGAGFGSYEFHALDARTGKALWRQRTRDDGPTAAAVRDGFVAFNTESCTVCVLDVRRGRTVWERWLGDPLLGQPAVADDRLYMAWPAKGRHRLGAFDLREGRPLWEAELASDVISAPVAAEGDVYTATYDGEVACFDGATGRERFRRAMQATSAPWVWKGEVFVARREGGAGRSTESRRGAVHESTVHWKEGTLRRVHAARAARYLRSKRGSAGHVEDLKADAGVGFHAAPPAAKLEMAEALVGEASVRGAWRFQGSRPCVWNGIIFATAGDVLSATAVDTGAELWRWEPPRAPDGDGHQRALSPPAAANGRVWAVGRDGCVRSWDAATGALRWSVTVGPGLSWQPAVHRGRVYVGRPGGLVTAFATGDPRDDGWPMWGGGGGHNGA